jgi:hypothetical protein
MASLILCIDGLVMILTTGATNMGWAIFALGLFVGPLLLGVAEILVMLRQRK